MAIPKYDELYRDFLDALADGETHSLSEIRKRISIARNMPEEDLQQLLPSGTKTVFADRVSWAGTYLHKAGLIARAKRGRYEITPEGKRLQSSPSIVINNKFLLRYRSFADYLNRTPNKTPSNKAPSSVTVAPADEDTSTPQDTIETAFQKINSALADELMDEIMAQSPDFFEKLVIQLLLKMGYGGSFDNPGLQTPKTNDGGIDGIIKEDKLGFSQIYIQAKCWNPNRTIGCPEIQQFSGALHGKHASKGLFITTARFSKKAEEFAKDQHIILVNGDKLTKLMIEYDIGVSVSQTYSVKKLDSDFFSDD